MNTAHRASTLTYRETWEALGISRSTFFALKRLGHFDHLEVPRLRRMSRAKVEEFIDGRRLVALRKAG